MSTPLSAHADTPDDLATRQHAIDQVRDQLKSNLADALTAQEQLAKSLRDNAKQQDGIRAKIDDANRRIAELDEQIAAEQREIQKTERRIEMERAQIRALARAMYVQPASLLVAVAQAHDLGDLLTRLADLSSAGGRARQLKQRLHEDLAQLDVAEAKLEVAREEQDRLRSGLRADLDKLVELEKKQLESARKLEDSIGKTRGELSTLDRQSTELSKQIADILQEQQNAIIAAAMQQVWDQVRIWQQQNNVDLPASAGHSTKYRFVWPLPGAQISQTFGPSQLAFEPAFSGFPHFHTGIDLVQPIGTPIQAADDGVVVLACCGPGGASAGYGNYVVIAHDGGLTTLYGHLIEQAKLKPGDRVAQGQVVGQEGSTGNSTGAHLHFELRVAGKPVDPSPYLPPGPPSDFRG